MSRPRKVEISHRTIVFTVLFLISVWFLYTIRDVVFQIFVALLIMTILNPTVTRLHKNKIPRVASVLIVYFFVVFFLVFSVAATIPALVEQSTNFANSLPKYLSDLNIPVVVVEEGTRQITSQLGRLPSQILVISVNLFSNVIAVITVFIFALYLLLAREQMDDQLEVWLKKEQAERIVRVIDRLEKQLGGWARGQLFLMVLVGVATYFGLLLLGIPFALPLALLAGILEVVPNIGPILSAIPSVIVGFGISPLTGVGVAALYLLIQNVEAYVLVPKVMQRSAGVSPIITLLALLVGLRVAGVVGAVLSVPLAITSRVFLQEFMDGRRKS